MNRKTSSGKSAGRPRHLSFPRRARLAAEVLGAYARVRRSVRRGPITDVVADLQGGGTTERPDDLALAEHLAWATARTLALLPTNTRCLMQALVLTRVMARRGLRTTFVLSASSGARFEAHAWLEHAGVAILQPAGADHQHLLRV